MRKKERNKEKDREREERKLLHRDQKLTWYPIKFTIKAESGKEVGLGLQSDLVKAFNYAALRGEGEPNETVMETES